jgi:hypothetical protein
MLHLIKLAVGVRDIAQLRDWQESRARTHPPLRHRTRNRPRRVAEILDGGSIYWVVAGSVLVRQRVTDIIEDVMEDGTACAGIVLDPVLVPVLPRRMKAFQGWRYLLAADAPADLDSRRRFSGEQELPPALAGALRELCLI